MLSGNASILNHEAEQRALRVFHGARGHVTYLGRFAAAGWYEADAPETGDGPLRKVIVLKLRPLDTPAQRPGTKLGRLLAEQQEPVTEIDIERLETEKTFVDPNCELYEAERRESKLVLSFSTYLRGKGHQVHRHRILPGEETRPLLTDLYVPDLDLLIEAKGSVTRENLRMALGQLLDYNRFVRATSWRSSCRASPGRICSNWQLQLGKRSSGPKATATSAPMLACSPKADSPARMRGGPPPQVRRRGTVCQGYSKMFGTGMRLTRRFAFQAEATAK